MNIVSQNSNFSEHDLYARSLINLMFKRENKNLCTHFHGKITIDLTKTGSAQ